MVRTIDICFAARPTCDGRASIVVVIDILRASSTIVTALSHGCREVVPVADVSEALMLANRYDDAVLAGERQARKPQGFALGNSPLEFSGPKIAGKTVVMSTTNGTKALRSIRNAREILIASFLNFESILGYLIRQKSDVLFYCAGNEGAFSLEDTFCASLLTQRLVKLNPDVHLSDAAHWSVAALQKIMGKATQLTEEAIRSVVGKSAHALRLKAIGQEADIAYCCGLNRYEIIPFLDSSGSIKSKKL